MTDTPPRRLFSSPGSRFLILVLLAGAMSIPIIMISVLIEDRADYQRDAMRDISQGWGGDVHMGGPLLIVPVIEERRDRITHEDSSVETRSSEVAVAPLLLLPETLDIVADTETEILRRGIFDVPVYTADIAITASFDTSRLSTALTSAQRLDWDRAKLALLLPESRSFASTVTGALDGTALSFESGLPLKASGISAALTAPTAQSASALTLRFSLNGANQLTAAPAGRNTTLALTGDWPDPSFTGRFLPAERTVSETGFSANWTVPNLNHNLPTVLKTPTPLQTAPRLGLRFLDPVDIYRQAARAAKYGTLFIALTFLAVFLMERIGKRQTHPAQFILIGAAQSVFFLLLLSLAEQIGFWAAYLLAAGATIALLTYYGAAALGLARKTPVLTGTLLVIYATLFLILQSSDYTLLVGSIIAFLAVAATMMLTRNEDWGGART